MSVNAALSLRAFLISSQLTYGYSPYSRKLGHWCSRTNLTIDAGLSLSLPEIPQGFQRPFHTCLSEEDRGVLGVLVEIGVEDSLVHEIGVLPDVKQPPEVVELEDREGFRSSAIAFSMVLPWLYMCSSLPGLTFAMTVNP